MPSSSSSLCDRLSENYAESVIKLQLPANCAELYRDVCGAGSECTRLFEIWSSFTPSIFCCIDSNIQSVYIIMIPTAVLKRCARILVDCILGILLWYWSRIQRSNIADIRQESAAVASEFEENMRWTLFVEWRRACVCKRILTPIAYESTCYSTCLCMLRKNAL